jgi:hypothetical protein
MTEYYNINYINDETDKLDKLAREINNKKTSLCKKVTEDFNKKELDWKNGIDSVINSQNFSYLPMNKNFNKGVNNYTDDLSLNFSESESSYSNSNDSNFSDFASRDNKYFKNNDNSSIDSIFIDSESIDTYLKNPKNKKNVKFNKLVESIDYDECSKDDNNIFEHIKKCNNCKNKLLKFLNNSNNFEDNNFENNNNICNFNNNNKNNNKNKNINNDNNSIFNNLKNYNNINIKEIVILIMIGIFIIIMLDLLLRK